VSIAPIEAPSQRECHWCEGAFPVGGLRGGEGRRGGGERGGGGEDGRASEGEERRGDGERRNGRGKVTEERWKGGKGKTRTGALIGIRGSK